MSHKIGFQCLTLNGFLVIQIIHLSSSTDTILLAFSSHLFELSVPPTIKTRTGFNNPAAAKQKHTAGSQLYREQEQKSHSIRNFPSKLPLCVHCATIVWGTLNLMLKHTESHCLAFPRFHHIVYKWQKDRSTLQAWINRKGLWSLCW